MYILFFKTKIQLAVFSTSRIEYLNMFGAALYINIHYYSCPHCNATCVGESSRHFHTRISEHRGISPRTNRPYSKTPNSNIYKHFLDTNHSIDSNNFSIIFSTSDTSIKVAESIFIHKLSPSLNGTMYSTPLQILG